MSMTMQEINAALEAMTRLSRILMKQVSTAKVITDAEIISCKELLPKWMPDIDVAEKECYYYEPNDTVYRVRDGKGHRTQETWTPDVMADSWEALDIEHAGTVEDPIPAKPNMRYYPDKYYLDGGKVYKCTRDTEIPVSQLPHELVGVYFEEVS